MTTINNADHMGKNSARTGKKRRISGETAVVIAACATTVGSFGVVISGIWVLNLAVN